MLGYALKYPDAVKGLILEAPAGLEQFPKTMTIGDQELPVFDPAIGVDFEAWKAAWEPTGALGPEMARDEQGVRDFFYFKERDPVTGAVSPSFFGYFKHDTEYARLHTDQRVAMISGNPAELEQWVTAFIYDIYTIGSELNEGDPTSLYSRLTEIEVPIFLAFGSQEPFIPSTSLNGLEDMANQVIIPFLDRMDDAGNPVVAEDLSGRRPLHPHRRALRVRPRRGLDFMKTGTGRRDLADGHRRAGQRRGAAALAAAAAEARRPSGRPASRSDGEGVTEMIRRTLLRTLASATALVGRRPVPGARRHAVDQRRAAAERGLHAGVEHADARLVEEVLRHPELPDRRHLRPDRRSARPGATAARAGRRSRASASARSRPPTSTSARRSATRPARSSTR